VKDGIKWTSSMNKDNSCTSIITFYSKRESEVHTCSSSVTILKYLVYFVRTAERFAKEWEKSTRVGLSDSKGRTLILVLDTASALLGKLCY